MNVEVAITGMSGRFPESDNIAEFSNNLYNKVDLVTEDNRRWEPGLYGIPRRAGKLKDISKFDSKFFGVNPKQADNTDPQGRILLELTYEAIVDAGYDPAEIRGKSIGVFIGNSESESEASFLSDCNVSGYVRTGSMPCMLANRISYTFDFEGPSFTIDTACSSGAMAMYEAMNAISRGECEAAIVGACHLCLRPQTALAFSKLQLLSDDGACKSFDASGNGYVRSEAIGVLFLQRSNAARRIYASVVNIKANTDGFKIQGITTPSAHKQQRLITEVYKECKLDPLEVSYVEAHGTGTAVGDPIEMSVIDDVFCCGRKEPLLVGSVKSNMGHSEPASGICGVIKILLAMEKKLIPPNLHFNKPNPNIKSLTDGKVKIVAEVTPWEGEYAAFSSFGFGGSNVHGVLKSNAVTSAVNENTNKDIPQLVLYNGRTEESVQTVFDYLGANAVPREFFALLHKSAYTSTQNKPFRGYKLLHVDEDIRDIQQTSFDQRPVWYVFTGMGCQWSGMARQLMQIETFAMSIKKSEKVLKPYKLDLIDLITSKSSLQNENVTSAFVSIIAVQVALVDILTVLGIKPDGIVGHSIGEIACAYADGSLTAEQAVLAAYYRAKSLVDSDLPEGAMAAVGMTWSEAKSRCPKDIHPSCHNAEDSVTVSGLKENVENFEEALKKENVFARQVNSCGYAFHCKYIFPAAEKLQASLEKVIRNPKPRTNRWIATSYPEEEWSDPQCSIADASYFVHNMISPVLFYEALRLVPKNAIIVEIAPHHLLQSITKRVVGPSAECIGLMRRNTDNAVHLLSSIGRLYTSGLNPDIEKLYPPVKFPVPRGTPMVSPLIKWDHSETWTVPKWEKTTGRSQTSFEVNAGPEDSPDHYLLDHFIDGRYIFPATGLIVLAWKAFAEIKGKDIDEFPVVFENLKFLRATFLSLTVPTKFTVERLTENGGAFEINEAGMTVCTGQIYDPLESSKTCLTKKIQVNKEALTLNRSDIYKDIKLEGCDYGPNFQGMISCNIQGTECILQWNGNWVTFLDTMLHTFALDERNLRLPVGIQTLNIDPFQHKKLREEYAKDYAGIPLQCDSLRKSIVAGGVFMKNSKFSYVLRQPTKQVPLLEEYKFFPYSESNVLFEEDAKLYEQYVDICSSVCKKISKLNGMNSSQFWDNGHEFKEIDEALLQTYLESNSDKYVLLRCLSDIMNGIVKNKSLDNMKICANRYVYDRENDLLSETLHNEIPLRTVFDTVLENTTLSRIKIAEYTEVISPLYPKIRKYVPECGKLTISYSLAHSNGQLMDEDCLPPQSEVILLQNKLSFDFIDVDTFFLNCLLSSESEFENILQKATSCLKDRGFLVLMQRTQHVTPEKFLSAISKRVIPIISESNLEELFRKFNLTIISRKSDSLSSCLYLLRKRPTSVIKESIIHIPVGKYDTWVDELRDKMALSQDSSDPERIWLVSEASYNSGIVGLVKCLHLEPGGSNIRCVFHVNESNEIPKFNLNSSFYKDLLENDLVMNVFKNGKWGSYRHIQFSAELSSTETEHAYLNVLTPGDLSSLAWIDSSLKFYTPTESTVLCQVYYSSLNFRDIMLASGKLPATSIPGDFALQDSILGMEFAGRTMEGDRVMGFTSHKAIATTVAANSSFLWAVPEKWTLEEAATVPVAYSTAYYALVVRGRLKRGDRVLIHSGSGGVGQAAISIALSLGCEIFTTVGSVEKREFLKKRFQELTDECFANSRDTTFEKHVLKATNFEGVDVVLNSLADEKLYASLNCLAKHGRFLEIGKYDLSQDSALGMAIFLKNVSFHGILLDSLFENNRNTRQISQEVVDLVTQGIVDGTVRPLNTLVFKCNEVEKAFRYMASGKHVGKVILKIKEEEAKNRVIPSPVRITAIKRTVFNPQKSYIIIGGLGGVGMELCHWMIKRGARNIVLTSRSGITTGYQKLCIHRWRQQCANVVVSQLNACKLDDAKMLVELASELGAVGGIFNLAIVNRDGFMVNQTVQMYEDVCDCKVLSTDNMDLLSRKYCPDLDWFVCFSSESSGRGIAALSNYGYANCVKERICEKRHSEGLPGLAIQWGPIGDVGVLVSTDHTPLSSSEHQGIASCLSVLDKFLQQSHPIVSSLVSPQPLHETLRISYESSILPRVANIFGIKDITSLSPETSMGELGMDSLMGVELRQILERDFGLVLSFSELRKLKIKDLKKIDEDDTIQEGESLEDFIKEDTHGDDISLNCLVPTETVIRMNTVETGCPLVVLHPLEGTVKCLQSLVEPLPCPVYGLQYTAEAPTDSIEHLSSWYWKHLKSANISSKVVHLAGYSFGATVACEMALQAENDPEQNFKVKSIISLDGSPLFAANYRKNNERLSKTEKEIRLLMLVVPNFLENVRFSRSDLLKLRDWAERVNFISRKMLSVYPMLEAEAARSTLRLLYTRAFMFETYESNYKLRTDINLIRSSKRLGLSKELSDAYDFEKICEGKITVYFVEGNHLSFVRGDGAKEVTKIISEIVKNN